ncbi:VOC family protein [Pantoea agglomerans]|uniref:VOC family protein n=1 Tax=Pantoea TaxID=53335 RepID=UPI00221EB5C1|nr:VOC family protein [Pantoea sp. RG18]MCW0939241.1 VOC family protein [Pantoea sp. RG18]
MKIAEIDHIHLYVENIEQAEKWYNEILGFERDPSLYFWFEQGGPLVIRNNRASLSLFLRKSQPPGHTVAFSVSDHDVSMSVYFSDLSNNKIEVTSYDYLHAKQILESFA